MKKSRIKVAIQGYYGCFHQIAAESYFDESIEICEKRTFKDVVKSVENNSVDVGIMAIENSIAGSILQNYNLLQDPYLTISGEIYLHIRQHLMVNKGVKIEDIKQIKSHPIAILQCMNYIESLGGDIELVESDDTALSAKQLKESGLDFQAVIASETAAKLYNMEIIKEDIHTVKNNYTRFLIIERSDRVITPKNADKASLYFKVNDEKGALLRVLNTFDKYNINMTKLQSYPIITDPFKYLFHVDIIFNNSDEFRDSIKELREEVEDFCICGVYKKGETIE